MTTRLAIFVAIWLGAAAVAQTPGPDTEGLPALNGVYFHSPSGWIGLPANPLMPLSGGVGKWLLGFGNRDAIADFPGPQAAMQTSQTRPTFYLRGYPPANGIYLVREIQKQDYRAIRMPVSGDFTEWAHLRPSEMIPIDTRHDGGNVLALTPRADLKPGAYAIVMSFDPNVRGIRVMYDFGVNP